jgi:hypothetical protein
LAQAKKAKAAVVWHPGARILQQLVVVSLRPTNAAENTKVERFAIGRIGQNCNQSSGDPDIGLLS